MLRGRAWKDRRAFALAACCHILRNGTPTRWRYEAACRHGLRTGLVLSGWSWARADEEAAAVVAQALRIVGAGQRPSWQQGQPEYALGGDFCSWCSRQLENSEARAGPQKVGFCDELCLLSSHRWRQHRDDYHDSVAGSMARYLMWRGRLPKQTCRECSSEFLPWKPGQRFCSTTCSNRHHADLIPPRQCDNPACGVTFQPGNRDQKFCGHDCYVATRRAREERACKVCSGRFYPRRDDHWTCSNRCAAAARRAALPERECAWCGETFQPGRPETKFCRPRCNNKAQQAKRKAQAAA